MKGRRRPIRVRVSGGAPGRASCAWAAGGAVGQPIRARTIGPLSWLLLWGCGGPATVAPISRPPEIRDSRDSSRESADAPDRSKPQYWIEQCERGDGEVCGLLGDHYARGGRTGWGYFPRSNERAAFYLGKGCKLGDPSACRDLGRAYLHGIGVEKNVALGARLLIGPCDRAFALSCMDAAAALYEGTGVERDQAHAERMLSSGCAGGIAGACDLKAHLFGTGRFSDADAPAGAPGIAFGTPLRDIEARCKSSGHTWTGDDSSAFCSGPVSETFPFPVHVSACDRRVCSVTAITPRADESPQNALRRLNEVERSLSEQYGLAGRRVRKTSDRCEKADLLPQCVSSGDVVYQSGWTWESHASVTLSLEGGDRGPTVTIGYFSPESAARVGSGRR